MTEGNKRLLHGLWMGTLAAGFIYYWINAQEFAGVAAVVRDIAPSIIFVALAILIASRDHRDDRRRQRAGEGHEVIALTGRDAMVHDIVAYGTGALVLALPLALRQVDGVDLMQGIVATGALLWMRWWYFRRTNLS